MSQKSIIMSAHDKKDRKSPKEGKANKEHKEGKEHKKKSKEHVDAHVCSEHCPQHSAHPLPHAVASSPHGEKKKKDKDNKDKKDKKSKK